MSPQYQILSELLNALRTSVYCDGRQNGIECQIYRLKLLLLTMERYGNHELDLVCPFASLREMQRLVLQADTPESAREALAWVDAELGRLIQAMENKRIECEPATVRDDLVMLTRGTKPGARI